MSQLDPRVGPKTTRISSTKKEGRHNDLGHQAPLTGGQWDGCGHPTARGCMRCRHGSADAGRGKRLAEPSPDKVLIKIVGPLIGTAVGWLLGWLPGGLTGALGSPIAALFAAVGGISGLIFSLAYKRYLGVVGPARTLCDPPSENHTMRSARALAAAISRRASMPIGC